MITATVSIRAQVCRNLLSLDRYLGVKLVGCVESVWKIVKSRNNIFLLIQGNETPNLLDVRYEFVFSKIKECILEQRRLRVKYIY